MDKSWYVRRTNSDFVRYLSRSSSISPVIAQVLINRGIKAPEEVDRFLNPDISDMADPFMLPDMEKAVERIKRAVPSGEKILIHGDYDADGVTATSILLITLRRLGLNCEFFIPNRFDHGYGFSTEAIRLAENSGTQLIITVDCGIKSFDETEEAQRRGIDVIITDHHEPYEQESGRFRIPDAYAVVNPKLTDSSAFSELSGAGIALKLSQALLGLEGSLEFFDLAALGTVADVSPILGDNRVIIKKGLELMNRNARQSIAALRDVSSMADKSLTVGLLSYTLIPRINASGRISEASPAVKLFISRNEDEIHRIARELNAHNARRQRIEEMVYREALSILKSNPYENCIVLYSTEWHEGVVGIVASKIAGAFQRPAFLLSVKDGIARGSARSIPSFDICKGLSLCSEYLVKYGGHEQAAGLALREEDIQNFEQKMNEIVSASLRKGDFEAALFIDAEVALRDINFSFVRELMQLEPFGSGNEEPLFASKSLAVIDPKIVGNNHLKMKLRHESCTTDAIGFDMGNKYKIMNNPGIIDAVFFPTINEWNSSKSIQLNVKDFRPST